MKPNAGFLLFPFFIGRLKQFLDLLHPFRIQGSRNNSLLTIVAHRYGCDYRDRIIVLERLDNVFADLLFSILDSGYKLRKLIRVNIVGYLGRFGLRAGWILITCSLVLF